MVLFFSKRVDSLALLKYINNNENYSNIFSNAHLLLAKAELNPSFISIEP
jgi:hypothetical protein